MRYRELPKTLFILVLYLFATLQFVRFYVISTTFYLSMPRYLSGHERLPFQERILPIFFIKFINGSAWAMKYLSHPSSGDTFKSAAAPATLAFYLLSLISFVIAGVLVTKLYRAVSPRGVLGPLVFPVFLVIALWTYVIHIDADYSYPYDFPSVAFFTGGLLAIYTRRFWPLAAIMFVGTLNRETTLFLIGIYILDAASREQIEEEAVPRGQDLSLRERFSLRQVPWPRVAILAGIWLALELTLRHHFAHNSKAEDYVRIAENLRRLRFRLLPAFFNLCGYVLPIVLLFRAQLRPLRFANYLYIVPLWFAVMFYTGVILETRIYGELCPLVAVASVVLLEEHLFASRIEMIADSTSESEMEVFTAEPSDYAA